MFNNQTARSCFLVALGNLLPTALICYMAIRSNHLYGERAVNFVQGSRATVQIIVQVVAHIIAATQIYCLCTLFNLATRRKLSNEPRSISKLSFWAAVSNHQMDWSLPTRFLLLTIFIGLLSVVPGALWTGAITPVVVLGRNLTETVQVPAYAQDTARIWNAEFSVNSQGDVWNNIQNCTEDIHDRRGLIPQCPVPTLLSLLHISASTGTSITDSPRNHSRLDNSKWSYMGRSYGVGSSIGLTVDSYDSQSSLSSINFTESGYNAQVKCIRNSSSDIFINYEGPFGDNTTLYYSLQGYLPNEPKAELSGEWYPVFVWYDASYTTIVAWAARSYKRQNFVAIAGNTSTSVDLDKIQCEITFNPSNFMVAANLTTNTIMINPLNSSANDIEPTGALTFNVIQSINLLSRMSPSLYQSVIGAALESNVRNMQTKLNVTTINDDIITSAVADSFTALVDDILVAYGASQLIISKDVTTLTATGSAHGVRLGARQYHIAVLILCSLMALILVIELVRNRLYHGIPEFDYSNLPAMMVAASAGGVRLANEVKQWHRIRGSSKWDGVTDDPAYDAIEVSVRDLRIVPVDGSKNEIASPSSLEQNAIGLKLLPNKNRYTRLEVS